MRHPLLVEGRPNCGRQSLASTLLAPRVAATSYSDPGRHANVITPCLLTPRLNVPKKRARSKISIHDRSLEISTPKAAIDFFLIFGPSGFFRVFPANQRKPHMQRCWDSHSLLVCSDSRSFEVAKEKVSNQNLGAKRMSWPPISRNTIHWETKGRFRN